MATPRSHRHRFYGVTRIFHCDLHRNAVPDALGNDAEVFEQSFAPLKTRVVGFCELRLDLDIYPADPEAALVVARHVGHHMGRQIEKLELHVFPHNDPAIKLYEQFGFEREGVRHSHFRRGGRLVDAVLMAYRVE